MNGKELDYYFYLERQQDKARGLLWNTDDELLQQFYKSVIWGLKFKEMRVIKNMGLGGSM